MRSKPTKRELQKAQDISCVIKSIGLYSFGIKKNLKKTLIRAISSLL